MQKRNFLDSFPAGRYAEDEWRMLRTLYTSGSFLFSIKVWVQDNPRPTRTVQALVTFALRW